MKNIFNKFLFERYKLSEIHLTQPEFTYSTCEPFTENKAIGNSRYVCRNELDKTCFKHDMLYGDFKDLLRRMASVKYFLIRHSKLLLIKSKMDIKMDLNQWSTKFLIRTQEMLVLIQE